MNAVEMIDIVKEYPGVLANDHVSLTVREGEIHGLVGENGAGKSTIMNQLYGMQRPTSGTIRVYGKEVQIHSPREAIALGIGMVHQHFMLAPSLSVLQNIILGNQPKKGPFIDRKTARRQVQEILDRYAFQLDLDARVYQLSVGQMQRVEIVKALYRGREDPDPGRAHRRADAPGGGGAHQDHAPAPGAGLLHHYHHPQAERGDGGHGPHHHHAQGRGHRPGQHGGDQ